jgi:hypothetical protein
MVINNFDTTRAASIRPTKANTPLIVDSNAVLARTIALECLKMIAGWNPQIIKPISDFKLSKFSPCDLGNIDELPDTMAF